jgi:ribosomal protein S18 acetylase RimI-like enzyme
MRDFAMLACVESPRPFIIRDAVPADIGAIMRLKLELAIADEITHTLRATPADWKRDAFGPYAHFTTFVGEWRSRVVGMAICGERHFPGWVGATIALLDLCVEERYRRRGIGTALLVRVAEFAKARNSVMIELTVRAGNPAARLYERLGYAEVTNVRNLVIAGEALERLAKSAAIPASLARIAG